MDTIKFNKKNTKIIAHRGLSGIERENTCPAFVAAGNRSYFGVETDVHVAKDGKFVIIHDETTERVTLGKINIDVEKSRYAKISKIVLPDLDESTDRKDIRIPLLEEYIKICKKYEKVCVLEIKNYFKPSDLKKLVEKIKDLSYLENMIFISFDRENCVNLRKELPDAEIQWLACEGPTEEIIEFLLANKLDFDTYYEALTKENIEKLHSLGIKVNCWTCDNKEEAEKLADYGVDFITTNILE